RKLYYCGGITSTSESSTTSDFFYLDVSVIPFSSTDDDLPWTDLTSTGVTYTCWGTAVAGGVNNTQFILFGGHMSPDNSSLVLVYDTINKTWSKPTISGVAPIRRRSTHAVIDSQGKMYIFGGYADQLTDYSGSEYFNDIIILDTINWSWSYGSSDNAPSPRGAFTATLLPDGKIVYIGGAYENLTLVPFSELNLYDTISDEWSTMTAQGSIPSPREGHSAIITSEEQIVVYGGNLTDSSSNSSQIEILDTTVSPFSWSEPDAYGTWPSELIFHTADLVGYMIGQGASSSVYLLEAESEYYIWLYTEQTNTYSISTSSMTTETSTTSTSTETSTSTDQSNQNSSSSTSNLAIAGAAAASAVVLAAAAAAIARYLRKDGGGSDGKERKPPITYGSQVAIIHEPTNKYLTTRGDKYQSSQQYVVAGVDDNKGDIKTRIWTVIGANGSDVTEGGTIPFNTVIGFKHNEAGGNLHSHSNSGIHFTQKSSQQQVTICLDINKDDDWIVRPHSSDTVDDASGILADGDVVNLLHVTTDKPPLYSHGVLLDNGTQEVSCYGSGSDENNKWRIEIIANPVKYGSTVAFIHASTGKYLSTKGVVAPGNTQLMVVCTGQEIDPKNDLWTVIGTHGTITQFGESVPYGTVVRLKHQATRGNLHSHTASFGTTPKSNQQQVTIYPSDNDDDNWTIRHYSSNTDFSDSGLLVMDSNSISLLHNTTNMNALYSHEILLDDGSQEVSCNENGHNENNKWYIKLVERPILYGSKVAFIHVSTGKYLSTKKVPSPVTQQYAAICTSHAIDLENDVWTVIEGFNDNVNDGGFISFNTLIGFKHRATGGNLHSHDTSDGKITIKSSQQQVTVNLGRDANDDWLIRRYSPDEDYDNLGYLMDGDIISLSHNTTNNQPLYSRDILLDDGTQEVSCNGNGHDENNK
ncbi:9841_t:CDS:10, partial [Acaulospora morrowiae]